MEWGTTPVGSGVSLPCEGAFQVLSGGFFRGGDGDLGSGEVGQREGAGQSKAKDRLVSGCQWDVCTSCTPLSSPCVLVGKQETQ